MTGFLRSLHHKKDKEIEKTKVARTLMFGSWLERHPRNATSNKEGYIAESCILSHDE
jgi:hypothetical protein